MTETTVIGAGLCGSVKFAATLPSLWCAHCHCHMCQRFHGAPLVTWVGFAEEGFRITVGENTLRWYASSPVAQRGFCGDCGSSMLFKSEKWPDEMHVCLPNIQDPIDRQPEGHAHYGSHVDWLELADDLPRKI